MSSGPLIDSYDSGDISKIADDQILVGRYKVLARLGSGGTSNVYKASDLVLKRFVAVKILRTATRTPEQLVRLQREARAICQLQHPNIIDAFDFVVGDDNIPVLAMEFVDGISLDDLVRQNGPLDLEQAIAVGEQICSALDYAHQHNIMHRDLKPANVIVQNKHPLEIKVIDFGIAKLADEDASLTGAGMIVGTPSFISPEQANGDKVDIRSDIYSLGCLMYKILTGRNPFRGATVLETLQAQILDEAPALKDSNNSREYPEELEEIVAKALMKDPDERFQTMREFSSALRSLKPAYNTPLFEANEIESAGSAFQTESKRTNVFLPVIIFALLVVAAFTSIRLLNSLTSSDEPAVETNPESFLRFHQIGQRTVGRWTWYYLNTNEVLDNQIEALSKLKAERLTLSKTNITDSQLKLVAKLPLKLLDIRQTKITNEGVRTICDTMPNLKSLIIEECPNIDSKGYQELRRLGDLRVLSLRNTTVSDKDLKILCPALSRLNVLYVANSPNITDDSIDEILKLRDLYALRIDGTRISPNQVNRLSALPRNIFLGLGRLGINDTNMPDFSKNISMLDLPNNAFSIVALEKKVLNLPELWYIDLRGCQRINEDLKVKHILQDKFKHTQGYVILLDDHEGLSSPEGYLNAETYRDNTLKQFTLEERKAVIQEALHVFPTLEKGF